MSMIEWAKREIEIAQKRERGNASDGEWDYGGTCYDSAFKAFQSLCEDGHSGMSIGFTKNILNRLIDGKPLTHQLKILKMCGIFVTMARIMNTLSISANVWVLYLRKCFQMEESEKMHKAFMKELLKIEKEFANDK